MSGDRDRKCAERVQEHLDSRIEDLGKLWGAWLEGEEDVEDLGSIFEYGLAFDYVPAGSFTDQPAGYFRYQLSWGGPSDEFRFMVGPEFEVQRIEYWFLDWYDGAHRVLTYEKRELLSNFWNWFKESGTVEAVFKQATEG